MNKKHSIDNLFEVLNELEHAEFWLKRSWSKCKDLNSEEDLIEQQYDDLEAFTSRFSRASDLLLQKVFRAICSPFSEQVF